MGLHEIQTRVHVAKDKRNDFGGYNYRTAEGTLAALKAALPDGATVIVTDALQELAGQIFVSATATITFADGTSASATGHAMHPLTKKGMDPSQITGTASSYARKYALAGLLALDDGSVDPDAAKQPYEPAEEQPAPPPQRDARKIADSLLASIGKATNSDALLNLEDDADGKFAKAWEWLKLEKPPMALEVRNAFDKRMDELNQKEVA